MTLGADDFSVLLKTTSQRQCASLPSDATTHTVLLKTQLCYFVSLLLLLILLFRIYSYIYI